MKRLLFLVQLPPPLHGAAVINKLTVESKTLTKQFEVEVVPLIMNRNFDDLEAGIQFRKISLAGAALGKLISQCVTNRPHALILTLSLESAALIRDAVFIEVAKFFKIPNIILHLHGTNLKQRALNNSRTHSLYQRVFNGTKTIILSERLYPDIAEYIGRDQVRIVHNGAPDPFAGQEFKRPKSQRKTTRLLFLSNLSTAKGTLVLLRALGHLHQRSLDFEACFAGPFIETGLEQRFHTEVEKLGLEDKIHLPGAVYDQQKHDTFSNADIFVFPTLNECFPVVLLEASAYGLPIVASREGGIPDIVANEDSGLLFEKGNDQELARHLETLILDNEKRIQMGKVARDRFTTMFTDKKYELGITQAIRELTESPRAKA